MDDERKKRGLRRRLVAFGVVAALLVLVFTARLVQLQLFGA